MEPSRTLSLRAISAPPKRPEHIILTPLAPMRIVRPTHCFIARRKPIRRSSWLATFSATRVASISACLISAMLTSTVFVVKAFSAFLISSMPAPPRPITMPGLAVWIINLIRFAERSISIRETPAMNNCFFKNSRIFTSSFRSVA